MMTLKIKSLTLLLITLLLGGFIQNSNATHISEPILLAPQTNYFLNETITINGWVSYDNQPTADVLLSFKVFQQDDTEINNQLIQSDNTGHFKFEFNTTNQPTGTYRITVTSHCLDIHRAVCTYQKQSLLIHIKERLGN